jgi:hypothetical protein
MLKKKKIIAIKVAIYLNRRMKKLKKRLRLSSTQIYSMKLKLEKNYPSISQGDNLYQDTSEDHLYHLFHKYNTHKFIKDSSHHMTMKA